MRFFHTIFLDEADKFIASLKVKAVKKILYNIDLAEQTNDPRLFKKLKNGVGISHEVRRIGNPTFGILG
jgi:uncharacterized protein YpiB (UPF0302 family)